MATASLVIGIISLVLCTCFAWTIGGAWLGVVLAIVGVVLACVAKKAEPSNGMATAGLVLSIIAVAFGLIVAVACTACYGCQLCAVCRTASGF